MEKQCWITGDIQNDLDECMKIRSIVQPAYLQEVLKHTAHVALQEFHLDVEVFSRKM